MQLKNGDLVTLLMAPWLSNVDPYLTVPDEPLGLYITQIIFTINKFAELQQSYQWYMPIWDMQYTIVHKYENDDHIVQWNVN